MSIYATSWILKFPKGGYAHHNCEWIEVYGQGVPAHIGTPTPGHGYEAGDPYAAFLPPAIQVHDDYGVGPLPFRAMVIVTEGATKTVQRYDDPLLVLSGAEYAAMSFEELHDRICEILRGDRPRVVGEWIGPTGKHRLLYERSSTEPPEGRAE